MLSCRWKMVALVLAVGFVVAVGLPQAAFAGDPQRCFDVTIKCHSGERVSGILCCSSGGGANFIGHNGERGSGTCEITKHRRSEKFTLNINIFQGCEALAPVGDNYELSGRIYFHGKLLYGAGTRESGKTCPPLLC